MCCVLLRGRPFAVRFALRCASIRSLALRAAARARGSVRNSTDILGTVLQVSIQNTAAFVYSIDTCTMYLHHCPSSSVTKKAISSIIHCSESYTLL